MPCTKLAHGLESGPFLRMTMPADGWGVPSFQRKGWGVGVGGQCLPAGSAQATPVRPRGVGQRAASSCRPVCSQSASRHVGQQPGRGCGSEPSSMKGSGASLPWDRQTEPPIVSGSEIGSEPTPGERRPGWPPFPSRAPEAPGAAPVSYVHSNNGCFGWVVLAYADSGHEDSGKFKDEHGCLERRRRTSVRAC